MNGAFSNKAETSCALTFLTQASFVFEIQIGHVDHVKSGGGGGRKRGNIGERRKLLKEAASARAERTQKQKDVKKVRERGGFSSDDLTYVQ